MAALAAGVALPGCAGPVEDLGPTDQARSQATGPSGSSGSSDDAAGGGAEPAGPATVVEVELPSSIWCGTQHRPDADTLEGVEEPTLVVDRPDSSIGSTATLTFPTMELAVTYGREGPGGVGSVIVVVRDRDGRELVHTLYQLPATSLDEVNFLGGHGFTGLQYVSHGPAQLQVWCRAQP